MTERTKAPGYEQYQPLSDPFNEQPPNDRGLYPARIHNEDGDIYYYRNPGDRRNAIRADQYLLELRERKNAPWYKKLWWSIKPEF